MTQINEVIVEEDTIRSNFINQLDLEYRLKLKDFIQLPHKLLEIDNDKMNDLIRD